MRLIGEAAGQRNVGKRIVRRLHELFGAIDTTSQNVAVRRDPEGTPERAAEVTWAEPHGFGQSPDQQFLAEVLLDHGFRTTCLPGRKATAIDGGLAWPNHFLGLSQHGGQQLNAIFRL